MHKITVKEREQKTKEAGIVAMYRSGKYKTETIARNYNLTERSVQRIATKYGVIRTQAEANRLIAPLKHYHHVPEHLRVTRKHISRKIRYNIIANHPFCSTCGAKPTDGIKLEVDHIDENPYNNELTNLQVLCNICNYGKSVLNRFGKDNPL